MLLKSYKPLLPTWRYKNTVINIANCKLPQILSTVRRSFSGRDARGSRIINTKTHSKKIKRPVYTLQFFKCKHYYLHSIGYNSNSTKFFNLWKDCKNHFVVLPAIEHSQPGIRNYFARTIHGSYEPFIYRFGFPVLLQKAAFFSKVSNLFPGLEKLGKAIYATSSGTYCLKLRAEKNEKLIKVKLPSTAIKFFNSEFMCFLGKNMQAHANNRVVGKAGLNIIKGVRQTVRGVAMNPVDHPNGGRTKSCSPELSPWGWIAKKNK